MNDKALLELIRLRDFALKDALSAPIEELRQDDAERGIDSAQAAEALRAMLRETAAGALRAARSAAAQPKAAASITRPSIDVLKAMIQRVFVVRPELKLAFRDGKKQSDEDWASLYDDLVDMGAIDPNAD